jgi:type 2 lantibiotic biosynthesis protein LanM
MTNIETNMPTGAAEAGTGWRNAATFTERLAALRAGDVSCVFNPDLAREQMDAWRSQKPFTDDAYFERLLESLGVTEEEFLHVLGAASEPCAASPLTGQRGWVQSVQDVFRKGSGDHRTDTESGFTDLLDPLIGAARARLENGALALASDGATPFDPVTVASLFVPNLTQALYQMAERTLVLELHVARLTESLRGDTPEERFQSFVDQMSEPSRMLTLLEEYPVLARQLALAADQWVTVSLEFLQRLTRDQLDIQAKFAPGVDAGKLVNIVGGQGDTHRRGRSVLIAQFESGQKVVYKPRGMSLDQHFQDLLGWVNHKLPAQTKQPAFRTLAILDRGEYGWVEFVGGSECTDVEQIQRFYRRQGGYIALLYALGATDMHAENVIAHGEHPVIVDVEALLHANLDSENESNAASRLAHHAMMNSVLLSGLLPQRLFAEDESDGVDLSALGATGEQLSLYPVPQWVGAGTDELHMIRERLPIEIKGNRPKVNGTESSVLDFAEELEAGFKAVYHLLAERRAELLSATGPLQAFASDEVRTILRATQTYAVLLRESFHPDMLRDALERDRLFAQLWLQVEQMPYLARAIQAETEDLEHGDIPMFTSRPDSRDLWTATGERIPDFYAEPSLTSTRRRLEQMGDRDLERQLWLIRASLISASRNHTAAVAGLPAEVSEPDRSGPSQWIEAARAVGDRLEQLAYQHAGAATWITIAQSGETNRATVPVGTDLYDGAPGIALFLAYLGFMTGEERYETLARAAIRGVCESVASIRGGLTGIGAFNGWGGLLYAFTHLGSLWQDQELLAEAEAIVDRLPQFIARDQWLDVIAGSAGCIGALLSLDRCRPSEKILTVARQCGERLLDRAQTMTRGIAWDKKLGGFAHGAAGIGWALLELAAATGEEKFRAAALEAIDYDRSLFSKDQDNWLDLRHEGVCATAWCHGAPGIGLARLSALQHCNALRRFNDAAIRAEIAMAVEATLKSGFGGSNCLCHGDMGNVLFLMEASEFVASNDLDRARRVASGIARRIPHGGPEALGLMTGLAGIGYAFLRLSNPGQVPSVLVLESPRRVGQ